MFFTCQKDDTFTEEPITTKIQTKNSLQVKKVSLNDVKQHTLIKKYLDKIEKQFDYNKTNTSKKSKSTSTSAVAINSKDNTFTILTDEIIEVSTDSTKVYTFRIETPTKAESDFENFVIHKKSNDSIEYYIYRYKKNDEQNDAYSFSREQVSSDQINKADFQDYTRDLVLYDPVSDCLYEFSSVNGVLIIDILECNVSGSGYGTGGTSSGGTGSNYGTWNYFNPDGDTSNGCIRTRSYTDANGNPQYETEWTPCLSTTSSDNSTSTWPNSGGYEEPDSNVDNLHNTTNTSGPTDFGGGSGSTSTSSSSSNTSSSVIIGVLPDKIDVEINSFFDTLSQEQKDCLNSTFNSLRKDITTFFKNNQTIAKPSKDGAIFDEALIPIEAKEFAKSAIDINCILPNVKFERIIELDSLLKENPWALIQDCAEQNGLNISNYQQLYDHTLPSQCIDRLNVLGDNFENQPLSEGNAAVANVDYYGVEIITRPDINGDGVPDTNAEIFQAYKINFSSLASGEKDNFEFSCNNPFGDNFGDVSWTFSPYFANDNSIWSSTNPLTAIFKIDASADGIPFGNTISDDGAIMISGFTSEYWIGSTITTEFSGTQPFSGNRQWGYITNLNGNLELYARAVDVARVSNLVKYFTPGSNECKEDSYYNIGEATWSNLQDEIKQFIVNNGGQAITVPKTAIRFDKTKLKEVLESNETIDQIPCN